jgi:hypothetical protein
MAFKKNSTRTCVFSLLASICGLGVAARAEEITGTAPPVQKKYLGVAAEGKTLPQGVARARVVHRSYTGTQGFDKEGVMKESGFTHKMRATVYVAEVGITDRLSFQVLVPTINNHSCSFDAAEFKKTALYRDAYEGSMKKVYAQLQERKLCPNEAACRAFVENNGNLSFPIQMNLPTGEIVTLAANTPFRHAIEDLVVNGARPAEDGATGLGDIEAGLLYSIHSSDTVQLSAGAGVRAPTGKYSSNRATLPIGSGIYDAGLRYNADFSPVAGLWLSWQQQLEYALTSAEWKRASLLDNQLDNEADPYADGDKKSNTRRLRKRGIGAESMAKVNYGIGALHPILAPLSINSSLIARHERASTLDGETVEPGRTSSYLGNVGAQISGLPHKIPVELSFNHASPLAGSNKAFVDGYNEFTLKLYYRF